MKKYSLFLILSLFLLYSTAYADFYTWEDENGATQITDYPPPVEKSVKGMQIHKSGTEDLQGEAMSKEGKTKTGEKNDVVLYTKNNCKDCDNARAYLTSKNISFTEYNMDTDKDSAVKRKAIDNSEDVPFAIINKNQIYGFSESVYKRVLKID